MSGPAPLDMVLHCPKCGLQHIDADNSEEIRIEAAEKGIDREGDRAYSDWLEEHEWTNPPHRSHLCHGCGHVWRPADVPTNGVKAAKTKGTNDSPIATSSARPASADWRKLALQFDGQRLAAMAHLRTLLDHPEAHADAVRQFLAAAPSEQARADIGTWSRYVAGMVVAYLGGPVDDERIEPIAGIIERRMYLAKGLLGANL